MKSTALRAAAALVLAAATVVSAEAAEVGVSVQISQPGVYGRVDIGRFPTPQLVLPSPVIIVPPPPPRVVVGVVRPPPPPPQPVYLWVPPGHQKDWRKHCYRYNACGVPVYFVQDGWYNDHVHPKGKGKDKDKDKGHGKGRGHDDDRGRGDDHGKGHGKRD